VIPFDEEDEDLNLFGDLMGDDEVKAGSGKTTPFALADVQLAIRRIDNAGVLPKFEQWRKEDRAGKHAGGRTSMLSDLALLVGILLLRSEGSATLISELTNLFWMRLPEEAQRSLGIYGLPSTGITEVDQLDWYHRISRRLHNIIDLMDAWPVKHRHKLMNKEEREAAITARDKNTSRIKRARLDWFTNAMLEMTFQAQPRWLRRRYKKLALSMDQTSVRAPSQKGRRARDQTTGEEITRWNKKTGEIVHKMVLEIDADWYPVKSGIDKDRDIVLGKKADGDLKTAANVAWEWVYMANLTLGVNENPREESQHPHLVLAASLSQPNKEIGREVITAVASLQERGHNISRLSTDRGYGPYLGVEDFHGPLKKMGVPLVMDYKKDQLGINGGHKLGGTQVEGAHYCPSTPEELLMASVTMEQGDMSYTEYQEAIEERRAYRLRPKEKPDSRGYVPMMCPALGPSATLECPLRELHAKASKKPAKIRPMVRDDLLPENGHEPKICTSHSVSFSPEEGLKHEQDLHYGSEEWLETYRHDRNSMEGHNDYLKSGPERLADSRMRRIRGMAAQQFLITFQLVSANLRKIARFLRDAGRAVPKKSYPRRRDIEKMSTYVRWRTKIETVTVKPVIPPHADDEPDPPLRT
jgi:hypothetical protein